MSEAIQIAIIASLSALLGGILANRHARYLHRMDEAKALRQFSREKLERIAELISSSLDWWLAMSSSHTMLSEASLKRCPEVRHAYNLACLYFPVLRQPIEAYSDSLIHMHDFFVDVWDDKSSLPLSAQAWDDPRYDPLIDRTRMLRTAIEDLISEQAKIYREPPDASLLNKLPWFRNK